MSDGGPKFLIALPRYRCHKVVGALKIAFVFQNPRGMELHFSDVRYAPAEVSFAWFERHKPEADGYLVAYEDGYLSYSPGQAFEAGYTPMD